MKFCYLGSLLVGMMNFHNWGKINPKNLQLWVALTHLGVSPKIVSLKYCLSGFLTQRLLFSHKIPIGKGHFPLCLLFVHIFLLWRCWPKKFQGWFGFKLTHNKYFNPTYPSLSWGSNGKHLWYLFVLFSINVLARTLG